MDKIPAQGGKKLLPGWEHHKAVLCFVLKYITRRENTTDNNNRPMSDVAMNTNLKHLPCSTEGIQTNRANPRYMTHILSGILYTTPKNTELGTSFRFS